MSKRSAEEILGDEYIEANKKQKEYEHVKKHTLDSDEDDSDVDESRYNVLDENDIQGEEEGVSGIEGGVKLTPFNMKEEMDEGHFDTEGHFVWKKTDNIKDHWLDNLDWVKIKHQDEKKAKANATGELTLGESSSDSEDEEDEVKKFDIVLAYRRILECMQPKETIQKTLQRLGKKSAQISSIERFRRKRAGIVDEDAALVTELTELANKILTRMGNMDIYQETYEQIESKFASKLKGATGVLSTAEEKKADEDDALDMYADDFDTKEKVKITEPSAKPADEEQSDAEKAALLNAVKWEFKWKQDDTDIHGPFSTEQMQHWVDQGYFKDGVFVRKSGEDSQFYTSSRVDFELYL